MTDPDAARRCGAPAPPAGACSGGGALGRATYSHASDDPDASGLRADVAARLRRACAHLDASSFADLVHEVVAFKRRWARRECWALPSPDAPRPHRD